MEQLVLVEAKKRLPWIETRFLCLGQVQRFYTADIPPLIDPRLLPLLLSAISVEMGPDNVVEVRVRLRAPGESGLRGEIRAERVFEEVL